MHDIAHPPPRPSTYINPYHHRIKDQFSHFVLGPDEAALHKNQWSHEYFKNDAPLYLEIGSGGGEFMHFFAQANPHLNLIGLDYRFKRSFHLAKKLQALSTHNFRFLRTHTDKIPTFIAPGELTGIFVFFPDPWPKLRHHKNRLLQKPALDMFATLLKPKGLLYIKTDHDGYMEQIEKVCMSHPSFRVVLKTWDLWGAPEGSLGVGQDFLCSFKTKFETLFLKQAIPVKAIVLERLSEEGHVL